MAKETLPKVTQLVNDKNNGAVNQFVITTEKTICFQSYKTLIAIYDKYKETLVLSPYWNYSKTTSKHLYIFLRDYTKFYVKSAKDVEELIKNNEIEIDYEMKF